MAIGDIVRDNQRNGYYNDWQICQIDGKRVYCKLVADDMSSKKSGEMAAANFSISTILEMEKV